MEENRILDLARFLDRVPTQCFSMTDQTPYLHYLGEGDTDVLIDEIDYCGIRAGIAGYAVMLFGVPHQQFDGTTAQHAQLLLDLTTEQADALFTPQEGYETEPAFAKHGYTRITAKEASHTLRHLSQTGTVHWFEDCRCLECQAANVKPQRMETAAMATR